MKLGVIGAGYVGLSTGVGFAKLGHEVVVVDINEQRVVSLRQGKLPIYEPGMDEAMREAGSLISFTTDTQEAVREAEAVFIAVGTPPGPDGHPDMTAFAHAFADVVKAIDSYAVLVIKSTVPVGTADRVKKEIGEAGLRKYSIVSNPEFLREGSALHDVLHPERVILGMQDEKAEKVMRALYEPFGVPLVVCDHKSAELIKYASNAFLATKISFINEMANICERVGGDVEKVAIGMGLDSRIGPKFLKAGIGYGGSCFPKDIDALLSLAGREAYDFKLLQAVLSVNEQQQEEFAEKISAWLKKCNGSVVGVWGLSFKPDTDDVRKSPAITVIQNLLRQGYGVRVYDPIAQENARKELGASVMYCSSAIDVADGADALALVTEWKEFKEVDMRLVKDRMTHAAIFDGRNFLDRDGVSSLGFAYWRVGDKENEA